MDQDRNQIQQLQSPRTPFQLDRQLGNLQGSNHENHFQFDSSDNPFSFYHEENHRDINSSQDQANENTHKQPIKHKQNHIIENNNHIKSDVIIEHYEQHQIGQNLNNKKSFKLQQSPKKLQTKIIQTPKKQTLINSPNLKMFKEEQYNLNQSIKKNSNKKIQISPKTQQKYKKQLNDDLQQLKRNFKEKDNKKKSNIVDVFQKGYDKINLNKTYAAISKKQKNKRQNQMQQDEIRMLVKMSFQKKKANYQMLKQWDKKRAQSMALHGKMIELLQNQIDLRIKSSLQNFQFYQTFFRQKAKQEEKYVASPIINTKYALQNNSLSKNVYINCSVILNSLCEENTNRCKKINDFIQLIRMNILKQLTQNHFNSSQRQLLKIRQKISTLKSSLKKYNTQTQEKTIELSNLFNEQSNNITNKVEKDFYRTQLSFLRIAIQQIEVQKKLGEYCLQYYHTAVQQQIKRSNVIRQAMITYSKGLKQTYNLQIQCSQIEQMGNNEQLKLIQEYYSLQEMFDSRTLELFLLKNQIKHTNEINVQSFTSYINKFNYEVFDSRIILLKEFTVKYITTGKDKEVIQCPCYLTITVDNFLHMFFNCTKNVCGKPQVTLKISSKQLEIKQMKDQLVDIVKKQQKRNSMISYFWDNKVSKVYRIRFNKKDNKEEFIDYITKLMIDS